MRIESLKEEDICQSSFHTFRSDMASTVIPNSAILIISFSTMMLLNNYIHLPLWIIFGLPSLFILISFFHKITLYGKDKRSNYFKEFKTMEKKRRLKYIVLLSFFNFFALLYVISIFSFLSSIRSNS